MEQQHNNKMLQIQNQAESLEYKNLTDTQNKELQEYARGFSQVIIGKESFVKMMQQMDSQLASGMLQHLLMSLATLDFGKEKEAAHAARKAYLSAMDGVPSPANFFVAGMGRAVLRGGYGLQHRNGHGSGCGAWRDGAGDAGAG